MTDQKDTKAIEEYLNRKMEERLKDAAEKGGIQEDLDIEDIEDLADLDAQIKENYARTMDELGKGSGNAGAVETYLEKQRRLYGEDE